MRELDEAQQEQLKDALVRAFPTRGALNQLVRFGVGKDLGVIVTEGNIDDMVFHLINWTETYGRRDDLVHEAFKRNTGNPALLRFRQEVWEPLMRAEKAASSHQDSSMNPFPSKLVLSKAVISQQPMANRVANSDAIAIYYSYTDEDARWLSLLQKQLSALRRRGLITEWHRGITELGEDKDVARVKHLNEARMIILLISPDFLVTEHTYSESEHAMQRHDTEGTVVIPIIVRPTADWHDMTFGKLQNLPRTEKAIAEYAENTREKILLDIATNLKEIVQKLRTKQC